MISVTFTSDIENITCNTHVYQWDNKRTLEIKGLTFDDTPAVHFANKMSKTAVVVEPTIANGVMIADIPNSLLCEPHHIIAYVYSLDDNQCKTVKTVFIPLEKRPKPDDFVFEGNEGIVALAEINAKVDAMIITVNAQYEAFIQTKDDELDSFMTDKTTQINNFIASQNADREAYQNQLNSQFESFQNNVASSHNHDNRYYTKSEFDTRVLDNLGGITQHYVWEKTLREEFWDVAPLNKTTTTQITLYSSSSNANYYKASKYKYGTGVTVDSAGNLTLTGTFVPSQTPVNDNSTYWNDIASTCYISISGTINWMIGRSSANDTSYKLSIVPVTTFRNERFNHVEYLNSSDENAYPIGEHDGYYYALLGKIGDSSRAVVGKYIGNGTYGEANPVYLNIGFKPKLVIVFQSFWMQSSSSQNVGLDEGMTFIMGDGTVVTGGSAVNGNDWYSNFLQVVTDYTGISWYYIPNTSSWDDDNENDAHIQLNGLGVVYNYIAFR